MDWGWLLPPPYPPQPPPPAVDHCLMVHACPQSAPRSAQTLCAVHAAFASANLTPPLPCPTAAPGDKDATGFNACGFGKLDSQWERMYGESRAARGWHVELCWQLALYCESVKAGTQLCQQCLRLPSPLLRHSPPWPRTTTHVCAGAMNHAQFPGSCGKCVRVTGTDSGASGGCALQPAGQRRCQSRPHVLRVRGAARTRWLAGCQAHADLTLCPPTLLDCLCREELPR